MKTCAQKKEVAQAVRSGQWPLGCAAELHEHVAACEQCNEEARLLSAFATARNGAMRKAPPQSAGLLWWKAQLRRRRETMERLERPGLAIPTAPIAASVILLIAVLATAWKRIDWSRLTAIFSPAGWNAWILAAVSVLLCGFAVVAVVVGFGLSEERG